MTQKDSREQLLEFINKKIFAPVLKASAKKMDEQDKKVLEHLQEKTESEKKKFNERYKSAKEVKENYLENARSKPAQKIDDQLEKFNLPTFPRYKDEFSELCKKLDV